MGHFLKNLNNWSLRPGVFVSNSRHLNLQANATFRLFRNLVKFNTGYPLLLVIDYNVTKMEVYVSILVLEIYSAPRQDKGKHITSASPFIV